MGSLSPVTVALIVVCFVAFVGAFLAYFRDRKTYAGHEEYVDDVRAIAQRLNGDLFREGEDLVVYGNLGRLPAKLRFSYADDKPAMHIHVECPSSFVLSIVPRGVRADEGRVVIRTQDPAFDARFTTRTDNPIESRLFLSGGKAMDLLRKLCCSSQTLVALTTGAVELSELAIPTPHTVKHINEHLDQIEALSAQLMRMPKAHRYEPKPRRRPRRWLFKTAMVLGIVAALGSVITATKGPETVSLADVGGKVEAPPAGMRLPDAPLVHNVYDCRLATSADVQGDVRGWMNDFGVRDFGKLELSLASDQKNRDVAYLLIDTDGQRRVVVIADGKNGFEARFPTAAAIARVPKSAFANVPWATKAPAEPDGDGLLIVKNPDDRSSAVMVFSNSSRIVVAPVKDYQPIRLLE